MALLVWLPLDGNLKNYGLSDIRSINNTGFTVDDSGKIGKCYLTNSKKLEFDILDLSSSSWSLAAWFYPTSSSSSGHLYIISLNTSTASDFTCTLCFYADKICARTGGTTYQGSAITLNTWNHGVVTYDYINKILKIYHNGLLVLTKTNPVTPVAATKCFIGVRGNATGAFAGKLNDVRIYNHCLSYKEVSELAKGLVLHYKLTKPLPNLLKNGAFTVLTTGTAGLGTGIYANSWGGYNGGISNPTTNYHACINKTTFGYPVYMYNETNGSRNWKGISLSISKSLIEGSTDYIFSCDVYLTLSGGKIYGGFYYKKTGASSRTFASGLYTITASMIPTNNWARISIKVPFNDNIDSSETSINFYIYGYGFSDNGIVYLKNVKLEKGLKTTKYIPNESDSLYAAVGYDSTTELDCAPAGNQNDGTLVGTITPTADSSRYETSYYFASGANYINAGRGGMVTDAITVNLWVKYTTWGNPVSCTEGGGWNFENSSGIRFPIYTTDNAYRVAQSSITPASLNDGKWHMLTGTYNGLIGKIYIDGEELGSITGSTEHKDIKYHGSNVIFLGAEAAGNATTPASTSYIGNLSDFRIYCTALSSTDIKELYDTAALVDKNGNIYAYEFYEGG